MASRKKTPSLAKMFTPAEIAKLRGWEGKHAAQRARRWLIREGLARRTIGGHVYTTVHELLNHSNDRSIYAQARKQLQDEGY